VRGGDRAAGTVPKSKFGERLVRAIDPFGDASRVRLRDRKPTIGYATLGPIQVCRAGAWKLIDDQEAPALSNCRALRLLCAEDSMIFR